MAVHAATPINHYRGWRSTKLHLALISMALVSAGFAFSDRTATYGEFCMALIGAAGIYSSSAAAEKFASRPR